MTKKLAAFIIIPTWLLFIATTLQAQQSNTSYFMFGVPQSNLLNPATQPACNFYLGLPGVAPLGLNLTNSAFGVEDVIFEDPMSDSLITFLHPNANLGDFLDNFKDVNDVNMEFGTSITSFGFRVKDWYFSMDVSEKATVRFSYPGDLIKLALQGNDPGDHFDFTGLGLNTTAYQEFAIGASKKFSEEFTAGVRGKLLFGLADLSTRASEIGITTGIDKWDIRSKFEAHGSIPFSKIPVVDGNYKFDSITFQENIKYYDARKAAFSNVGLGIDLGAQLKVHDRIILSASLLDIGFIHWKTDTYNLSQDASFTYDGVDIPFVDSVDIGSGLLDSLDNTFVFVNSYAPYNTHLTGKLYLGGRFMVSPKFSLGVLSRTAFYRNNIDQQFTFSANFYPVKMLAASFSYTIMNNTYNNFGMGLSAKLGPFNMFLVSDLIPLAWYREASSGMPVIPATMRSVNLRVGFNLMFGCNKKIKDFPMIE